jgi:hypothetical protein
MTYLFNFNLFNDDFSSGKTASSARMTGRGRIGKLMERSSLGVLFKVQSQQFSGGIKKS